MAVSSALENIFDIYFNEKEETLRGKWGPRENIFSLGKKINEVTYHEGKTIASARKQVELLYGWFPECQDRRTRRIGKHWFREILVERQTIWDEYQEWKETKNVVEDRIWSVKFEDYTEEEILKMHEEEEERWKDIPDRDVKGLFFDTENTFADVFNKVLGELDPEEEYKKYLEQKEEEREAYLKENHAHVGTVRIVKQKPTQILSSKFLKYYLALSVMKKWTENRDSQYILTNPVYVIGEDERRSTDRLTELHVLYCEIDQYSEKALEKYRKMTARQVETHVVQKLRKIGFPLPTEVTYGRGLQLWWKIGPIPEYMLEQWRIVMNFILSYLAEFGADYKAKDPVRILRAIGSKHEKTGKKITGKTYTNDRIDFHDILNTFCKEEWEEYVIKKKEKRKKVVEKQLAFADLLGSRVSGKQQWMIEQGFLTEDLNPTEKYDKSKKKEKHKRLDKKAQENPNNYIHAARRTGIFLLCDIRNGFMDGCREFSCFYVRYLTLCMTGGNKIEALRVMKDLYDSISVNEYTWEEMVTRTSSAELGYERWRKNEDDGYNYWTDTLITKLEIKPHEMKKMKYIVTPERSAELKLEYNRNYNKETYEKQYEKKKQKNGIVSNEEVRQAIIDVTEENPDLASYRIAKIVKAQLGKCSKNTVDKVWKGIGK